MASLIGLTKSIQKKELSPVELVKSTLEKIEREDKKINAFITVSHEEALRSAYELEEELVKGKVRGKLHGIPIAIKDLIYTKGIRTTMGSKIYENFIPTVDATVVKKLKNAGAIIIGKTNTHEFAYGPTGDRSYFGPTRNPYNLNKISGGSSGGSGAAVAADMVTASLGTDTGGSIRIPASACGLVGMKPTFGLVSKYNVFNLAYTLDHLGPMTKNVKDNALLLNVISGYDPNDPYSIVDQNEDYESLIGQDIQGKIIGIPSTYYFDSVEVEVKNAVDECITLLESLGATVIKVNIPCIEEIAAAQAATIRSEAAGLHVDTFEKHQDIVDDEFYERLKMSRETKGYEYVQAQLNREKLIHQFNEVFKEVDVLITPTLPILPPNINQREISINNKKEHVRNALTKLTSPTNFTGNPSLSFPFKISKNGLPIGVQLIAEHKKEAVLYQFGYVLELSRKLSPKES